jgi:hypothetical protein
MCRVADFSLLACWFVYNRFWSLVDTCWLLDGAWWACRTHSYTPMHICDLHAIHTQADKRRTPRENKKAWPHYRYRVTLPFQPRERERTKGEGLTIAWESVTGAASHASNGEASDTELTLARAVRDSRDARNGNATQRKSLLTMTSPTWCHAGWHD